MGYSDSESSDVDVSLSARSTSTASRRNCTIACLHLRNLLKYAVVDCTTLILFRTKTRAAAAAAATIAYETRESSLSSEVELPSEEDESLVTRALVDRVLVGDVKLSMVHTAARSQGSLLIVPARWEYKSENSAKRDVFCHEIVIRDCTDAIEVLAQNNSFTVEEYGSRRSLRAGGSTECNLNLSPLLPLLSESISSQLWQHRQRMHQLSYSHCSSS